MLPVGFKPEIPTSKQPQAHALGHAATGIGPQSYSQVLFQEGCVRLL
jgi:hypothetical protein